MPILGYVMCQHFVWQVNTAKQNVDTLRNQGLAFTKGGIPPAQIKPKYDYSDVYNLNSLFKGQ